MGLEAVAILLLAFLAQHSLHLHVHSINCLGDNAMKFFLLIAFILP